MQHTARFAAILLSGIAFGTARADAGVDSVARAGDIQGTVNVCGTGGRPGILVYIPGRSFMARTDAQGAFHLSYVPSGSYSLMFEQTGVDLGRTSGVVVKTSHLTDLGAINVCANDGVCPTNYDPVCGIDGKTYPNPCEAQKAGVPIASTGTCN